MRLPAPEAVSPASFGEVVAERHRDGEVYVHLYAPDDGHVEAVLVGGEGPVRVRARRPAGAPSLRGLRVAKADEARIEGAWLDGRRHRSEVRVLHAGTFIFPIGPVRGDIMESIAWRLNSLGDEVVHLTLGAGYKHRGVEAALAGRTLEEGVAVAERVTGTSTVAHTWAYLSAVEAATGTPVPPRAQWLRGVLAEAERVMNHLGDLGTLAASTGLPVAQMELLALKESLLRLNQELGGHRYLRGMLAPGGLVHDPGDAAVERFVDGLLALRAPFQRTIRDLDRTTSFLDRLVRAGTVPPPAAASLEPLGPVGRACGRKVDARCDAPYGPYAERPVPVATADEGDAWARYRVRIAEVGHSLDWLAAARSLPAGPVRLPPGSASGTALARVEGPRGEIAYVLEVGSDGRVAWARIRTPSMRNWPTVPLAVANGNVLQDVPIIDASLMLSVAGLDL